MHSDRVSLVTVTKTDPFLTIIIVELFCRVYKIVGYIKLCCNCFLTIISECRRDGYIDVSMCSEGSEWRTAEDIYFRWCLRSTVDHRADLYGYSLSAGWGTHYLFWLVNEIIVDYLKLFGWY